MTQRPKGFSSYQELVAAQCQRNPCLRDLSDFLADSQSRRARGRIACFDFLHGRDAPRHRSLGLGDLAGALDRPHLQDDTSPLGRMVIVEDLSTDFIEAIASCVDIDPFFYASHLHVTRSERTITKGSLNVLPSRSSKQTFCCISIFQPLVFPHSIAPNKLRVDGNVRRKVGPHRIDNSSVSSMQSMG